MLLSLKIDDQIVKAYDIYHSDYKMVIAKIKVLLVNTESDLKNEFSHLEDTAILVQSKSWNILPESELKKKKYKNFIKKLHYVKVL